ncbi:hypothetical protein ACFW2V_13560 [Streptomyces sp. NPDC058947]|uniref:hypothetical protein n=1 Tax=Streptomyces sp. NPDC058947 TaxID=3346675 RepID=UPI0036CD96BA
MDRYEFKIPATVFIAVNAQSEEEARGIVAHRIGHRTDIPQPVSSAAQIVGVIPEEGATPKLNTVIERTDDATHS